MKDIWLAVTDMMRSLRETPFDEWRVHELPLLADCMDDLGFCAKAKQLRDLPDNITHAVRYVAQDKPYHYAMQNVFYYLGVTRADESDKIVKLFMLNHDGGKALLFTRDYSKPMSESIDSVLVQPGQGVELDFGPWTDFDSVLIADDGWPLFNNYDYRPRKVTRADLEKNAVNQVAAIMHFPTSLASFPILNGDKV